MSFVITHRTVQACDLPHEHSLGTVEFGTDVFQMARLNINTARRDKIFRDFIYDTSIKPT